MTRFRGTAAERFWPKVDLDGPTPDHRPDLGPCWIWTASLGTTGYGQFAVRKGVIRKAHRVAYEWEHGPVPNGLELDHLCRNTICVRPAHLEPVTHLENVRRGEGGAHWAAKTHCPHGHAYDEANTYTDPSGRRRCRTCIRDQRARWAAR